MSRLFFFAKIYFGKLIYIVLAIYLPTSVLFGCVTREEVSAKLWLNNMPIPAQYCEQGSPLRQYGFYRKLNDGNLELVSVCNPVFAEFFSMPKSELKAILDKTLPKEQ